jgi:hypothetical protein
MPDLIHDAEMKTIMNLKDLETLAQIEAFLAGTQNASHYVHKIHIPLTTNPRTMFQVGNQKRHLEVGEIMEVNNKQMHAVYNDGPGDRIHFIFECCNLEDYGKPD